MTVDALNMVLIAALVFLVLRQVMPIAAGLAGGVSLNSMGFLSRSVGGAMRTTGRVAGKTAVPAAAYTAPIFFGGIGGAAKQVRRVARAVTGNQFGRVK